MKKITICSFVLISMLLAISCNENINQPNPSPKLDIKVADICFQNVSVQQVQKSGGNTSFKIIAIPESDAQNQGDKAKNDALYLDLTADNINDISGVYNFNTAQTSSRKLDYGMLVLKNNVIGITNGSIRIAATDNTHFMLSYHLQTEEGKWFEGETAIDFVQNTNKTKATTSYYCPNCVDNYDKAITASEALSMAQRFAPIWKFDQSAPTLPDDIETIWNAAGNKSCGSTLTLDNRSIINAKNLNFTTYFDVQVSPADSRRVFIDYWLVYARQDNCIGSTGGHDFDWEHVVVQFNRSTWTRSTVTYFQHTGYYTKSMNADNPEVYIGKIAHGSYHNSGGNGTACCYWEDWRNPGSVVNAANKLYQFRCTNDAMAFDGNWGSPGKSPLYRTRDYWNFSPCKGSKLKLCTESGCYASDYTSTKIGSISNGF
jgi:hypothetical protein